MLNRLLADAVLIVHFAFIVFVLLGGYAALRWRWTVLVHVPCVVWGVYIMLSGNVCPLTPLENRLRRAAGGEGYDGGFIEHYIVKIIYPEGLERWMQFSFAAIIVLANVLAYFLYWRKHVRDCRPMNA